MNANDSSGFVPSAWRGCEPLEHLTDRLLEVHGNACLRRSCAPAAAAEPPATTWKIALAHNHPSGSAEWSRADELLTQTPKTGLPLVHVRVLDNLVVAGADVCSPERARV